jgi:hypothetical protein
MVVGCCPGSPQPGWLVNANDEAGWNDIMLQRSSRPQPLLDNARFSDEATAAPFWPRKNRDCLLIYQLTGSLLTRAPPEKVASTNNIA